MSRYDWTSRSPQSWVISPPSKPPTRAYFLTPHDRTIWGSLIPDDDDDVEFEPLVPFSYTPPSRPSSPTPQSPTLIPEIKTLLEDQEVWGPIILHALKRWFPIRGAGFLDFPHSFLDLLPSNLIDGNRVRSLGDSLQVEDKGVWLTTYTDPQSNWDFACMTLRGF